MITRKFITVVLTTLFLGLCSIQAWAVSFTVMTDDYSKGNVKYKLKDAPSYTGPGSSFIVNANVGDSVLIVATSTSVYGFSYWDFDMANPPMAATNNYGYWIAVTEAYNGITVTAHFEDYCEVDTAMFRLNDPIPITTPTELASFITWVNGLSGGESHPNANAVLLADINMSGFDWVPIGKSDAGYSGVFNGNGHTVSGLVSVLYSDYTDYGFFGKLTNAEVKNLFVKGANFNLVGSGNPLNVGGLAGEIDGTTIISNCEASSIICAANSGTVIGGLVGRQNGGMIHSCIAISDMTGNTMGGLVGVIESGELYNSYSNPDFSFATPNVYYVGGLVAENSGTIQNCYVRPRDPYVNHNTKLGLLVGWNKTAGKMRYCYSMEKKNGQQQYVVNAQGTCHYRSYESNTETPYQYLRRDNQVTVRVGDDTYIPAQYIDDTIHNPACTEPDLQMLLCLNNWVTAKNNETGTHPIYSSWQRPTTMIINDDLPVLMMPGDYAEAIAATNGDPFLYYSSINNLIDTYTSSSQAIWLYKSKQDLASNDGSAAKLYIAEHDIVGKPLTVIPNGTVHAYVGVTLDNSAGLLGSNPTYGDAADYTDWHMFSTPLTDAPLGVHYTDDIQWPSGDFSQPGHPEGMPYYHFYDNEEAVAGTNDWERRGYFPSHVYKTDYGDDTSWEGAGGNYYRHWDYYTYYEPEYHWINFKRNDSSHWHQKAPDIPIYYDGDEEDGRMGNEHYLVKGRGYLLATRETNTFLQCHGTLNNDEVRIRVTRDGWYNPGYNFLGNPYLTYLDFDEFARVNGETLWGDSVPQGGTWSTNISNAAYAIIDEDPIPGEPDSVAYMRGGYKYYTPNASLNKHSAPRYIAPHQGFMILATQAGVAKFNTDMRSFEGDSGYFRGDEHPAYALINLFAIDGNGNRDITTVELGRPDKGGAPLMRELKLATCHVYSRYEGKDWAIAFTQPGVTEVAIRFEAYQDGEYTLRWDTENGEFHYLHLIDNLTGTDIDCLTASEYRFTSTTMDYKSRFRLVFGYTGIEEPEIEEPVQGNFAYQSGDALVVTGEGTVELFDVMGRKLNTQRIEGVQGTMSVSGLTPGVYLLRLATTKGIRVQKIVINQ